MSYNLGTATGRIVIDGSGAQKGFGVATTAANAFYAAVENKLDSVERLGDNLVKLGATGSAGLGVAVATAANFEEALSAVKAVSGATSQEMDKLRKVALRIGKDTSFSASEAVNAMEELVKAGVSTTDIMNGAADATVALAAAGGVDLPTAAEIAANALNQFNLQGKDMAHVADLIAGAANASAIDMNDFKYSLSQAGAVASLTGLKFDDLAVAIAEMGQAGIKGSDAGTSIKTFLTNLIPTTDRQVGKFQELGLMTVNVGKGLQFLAEKGFKVTGRSAQDVTRALEEYIAAQGGAAVGTAKNARQAQELGQKIGVVQNAFFDANGDIKNFADIQETLRKAMQGLTKEQKLQTLEMLFGSDAIRAASVFAEDGAAGYNKMATAMGKVKAADVAATRLDNLKGSLEQLRGSLETMRITIGSVFLPVIRKMVDGLNWLVNLFNRMPEPMQKAIAVFLGLGAATSLFTGLLIKAAFVLGPFVARMLGLSALKSIFSIFRVGFTAFRGGAGAMAAMSLAAGRAGAVFARFGKIGKALFTFLAKFPKVLGALRAAFAFAFGPWGLLIAGIAIALVVLYKKFAPFKKLVDDTARAIKDGFGKALEWVKNAWKLVVGSFTGKGGPEMGRFTNSLIELGAAARRLWDQLKILGQTFQQKVLPVLKQAGGQILDALIEAWHTLAQQFQTSILPALKNLGDAFVTALPSIQKLWKALFPLVKGLAMIALAINGTILVAFIKLAAFLVGKVLPIFIKYETVVVVGLIKVFTWLGVAIMKVVGFFINVVAVITSTLIPAFNFLKDAINTAFNLIFSIVSFVMKGILAVITTGINLIKTVWTTAWNIFAPIVKGVFTIISLIIQIALTAILVVVTRIMDLIWKGWTTVWNLIVGAVQAVWNVIGPFVTAAATKMKNGLIAAWNAIKTATSAAWKLVQRYIIGPITSALASLRNVLSTIRSAIGAAWAYATGSTNSSWSRVLSTVRSKISSMMSAISGIAGKVKGVFASAGSWLVDAGRRIIQGLISGIQAMIGKLRGVLNSITNMLPDWKGPKSVDKKILKPSGQMVMEGFMEGIVDQIAPMIRQFQGITDLIPRQFSANAADIARSMGSRPSSQQSAAVAARGGTPAPLANGPSVYNNWNVYNPVAEKTSTTVSREATRRANIGMVV